MEDIQIEGVQLEENDYEKRFNEMQKFVPFLETLIKKNSDKPQLYKLLQLYQTLRNKSRTRLKEETLIRCESVLKKLWKRCDKGKKPALSVGRSSQDAVPKVVDIAESPTRGGKSGEKSTPRTTATPHVVPIVTLEETETESAVHRNTDDTPLSPDSNDDVMLISESDQNDDCVEVISSTTQKNKTTQRRPAKNWDPKECWEIPRNEPINNSSDCELWDLSEVDEEDVSNTSREPHELRTPQTMEKNWTPTYIQDYQDVATAVRTVTDKITKKKDNEKPVRPIPTVSVPSLEGSRRVTTFVKQKLQGLDTDPHHQKPDSMILDPKLSSADSNITFHKSQLPIRPPPTITHHRKPSPPRASPSVILTPASSPVSPSPPSTVNIALKLPQQSFSLYDKERRWESPLSSSFHSAVPPKHTQTESVINSLLKEPPLSAADLQLLMDEPTENEVNKEKDNIQMEGECAKFEKELYKVTEDIKKLNDEVTHSHKESKHSKKHHSKSKDEKHRHDKDKKRDKEKHAHKKHSSSTHKSVSGDREKSSSSDKSKSCSDNSCSDISSNSGKSLPTSVKAKSVDVKADTLKLVPSSNSPIRTPSPLKADKFRTERDTEIRYSDNYERHSRQHRENTDSDKSKERPSLPFIHPSENNSNILVIRPETPTNVSDNDYRNNFFTKQHDNAALRMPLHQPANDFFGGHKTQVLSEFSAPMNKQIPSLMSAQIHPPPIMNNSPIVNSSPVPPNDYGGPGNLPLAPCKPPNDYCSPNNQQLPPNDYRTSMNKSMGPDFGNQQWNAGNSYRHPASQPGPYPMSSNIIQDSWNRGPTPGPLSPQDPRPMNDLGRGINQYNNPVGMIQHRMPSNAPYQQYMNYPQAEPPLRAPWESNSIRPNDIHGNMQGSPDGYPCRPNTPYNRPNTPWGMSRGDPRGGYNRDGRDNRDNRDPRFGWDARNLPDRDLRNMSDRDIRNMPDRDIRNIPDRDIRNMPDRDIRNIPDRDIRNIPDRDPRHLPDRDPRNLPDRDPRSAHERDPRIFSDRDPRALSDRDPRRRALTRPPSPTQCNSSFTNKPQPQSDSTTAKPKGPLNSTSTNTVKDAKKSVENIPKKVDSKKGPVVKAKDDKSKSKTQKLLDLKNKRNASKDLKRDKPKEKPKEKSKDKPLEVMQSPLESLYGVVDTSARTGQGYGIQKFKIPKIKRKEPSPTPVSPPVQEESENWDLELDTACQSQDKPETSAENKNNEEDAKKENTEKNAEQSDLTVEAFPSQDWIKSYVKKIVSNEQPNDRVTEVLMQKLKSYIKKIRKKKVKKSLTSESSSSSDSEDNSEYSNDEDDDNQKKKKKKVKRPVIASDSSEDETLADRLSELKSSPKVQEQDKAEKDSSKSNQANNQQKAKKRATRKVTKKAEPVAKEKATEKKRRSSSKEKVRVIEDEEMKDPETKEERKASVVDNSEDIEMKDENEEKQKLDENITDGNDAEVKTNSDSDKAKDENLLTNSKQSDSSESSSKSQRPKTKRRNSLDMLHDDIQNMFICKDVITATGQRMCRIAKEGQGSSNAEASEENEVNVNVANDETAAEAKKSSLRKCRPSRAKKQPLLKDTPENSDNESSFTDKNSEIADEEETQVKGQKSQKTTRKKQKAKVEELKQPRIMLEKTDLTKFNENPKSDTSSDESLDIDESELDGAVDISLHQNLRSKTRSQQKIEKEKATEVESLDTAVDDAASFTGDESDASNTSITSAATIVNKRRNSNIIPPNAAEEQQLQQMLLDLVSRKNLHDDKTGKKSKKKKKSNWQMGILSKKKKQKKKTTKKTGTTPTELAVENVNIEATGDATVALNVEKQKNTAETEAVMEVDPLAETATKKHGSKEDESATSTKIDLAQLLEYVWGNQEKYKCLYCNFHGKNIVHHYATQHPLQEVLISRLSEQNAQNAIEEARHSNFESNIESTGRDICTFYCRFCSYEKSNVAMSIAVEDFYEHCTTHTGEYRFKCNHCTYRSLTKNAVKVHFYKVCRKRNNNKNATVQVLEDKVPNENLVFGYLCSKCNFVQMNKECVENHWQLWHANNNPEVDVIRINMSLSLKTDIKTDPDAMLTDTEKMDTSQSTELIKPKIEKEDDLLTVMKQEQLDESLKDIKDFDDLLDEIPNDVLKFECESPEKFREASPIKTPEKAKNVRSKSASSSPAKSLSKKLRKADNSSNISPEKRNIYDDKTDLNNQLNNEHLQNKNDSQEDPLKKNLSAFVCPPELEKLEEVLQRERQQLMKETLDKCNILHKNDDKEKRLSIIDKLKDKMDTNMLIDTNEFPVAINEPPSDSTFKIVSVTSIISKDSEKDAESPKKLEEPINVPPSQTEGVLQIKTEKEDEENEDHSQANTKLKDPLIGIETETLKGNESDGEMSDNATEGNALNYTSDTSSESYDHEESADVNSLLKESTNIKSPSRGLMMTTIQRLVSQLQKSSDTPKENVLLDIPLEIKKEKITPEKDISPSSMKSKSVIRNLFKDGEDNMKHFVECKEEPKSDEETYDVEEKSCKARLTCPETPPKRPMIRMRRFSGDLLSVPDLSADSSQSSEADNKNDDCKTRNPSELAFTENNEEASFIKISNVMSLAPTEGGNESNTPVTGEIRKTLEISPLKTGVSVLKKPSSIILKGGFSITKPITAINPTSKETVKLIPLSLASARTSLTNVSSQNNFVTVTAQPPAATYQLNTKNMTLTVTNARTPVLTTVTVSNIGSSTATRSPTLTPPSTLNGTPVISPVTRASVLTTTTRPSILTPTTRSVLTTVASVNKSAVLTPITAAVSRTPVLQSSLTTITRLPAPITVNSNAANTSSTTTSNANYKVVKVINSPPSVQQAKLNEQLVKIISSPKPPEYYNVMLTPEKLMHLYKCMGSSCTFTTNSAEQFRWHYSHHENNVDTTKQKMLHDFQQCAYCRIAFSSSTLILKHYEDKHKYCNFQCHYCFYRAVCQSYVEIHQTTKHEGKEKSVIKIAPTTLAVSPGPIDRHSRVLPYICQNDCSKFFYVPEAFHTHLNVKHNQQKELMCHVCQAMKSSPAELLAHYTLHKIAKYQCLYCVFGARTILEIHVHLCNEHFNQLPIILERTLPPQASRTRSAIDQLVLKNLECVYNSSDSNAGAKVQSQPSANATSTDSSKLTSISRKVNSPDKPSTSTSTEESSVLNTSADENSLNTEEIFSLKRQQTSPLTGSAERKRIRLEVMDSPTTPYDVNQKINPLHNNIEGGFEKCLSNEESSSNIVDGEEYISTNLLDNSDLLKFVDIFSGSKHESDANDDSDIEIIEDIAPPNKTNYKEEESLDSFDGKVNDKMFGEVSSTENSNASNDVLGSMNLGKKPLTLADIKDTGLTGVDLYKCPFEKCEAKFENVGLLKVHVKTCTSAGDGTKLTCTHCNKQFQKAGFFLEHLKLHGLKRFGCTMCDMRFAVQTQVLSHMKMKHKVNSKVIPADPTNPSADGLFIVQPINFCLDRVKSKKRGNVKSGEKDSNKNGDADQICFGPNDIAMLPLQAIFSREVRCAVCPYTNKVRTNIIRHLQLHAKDETVPESGPVNPVPCLDKKEKMFDKMVNLASSSHQNGRMGGKPKDTSIKSENENVPQFVPENKRYVCGVPECSYLSVDEAMLRCHMKALHSDEPYFRCPHCPQQNGQDTQNITIDKMGVHLKMHDTRLYKCSHCIYYHYHRHVVERHLTDKHPEKRQLMKVVREMDSTEVSEKAQAQEEQDDEQPDPDGNHWKCNMCDYKCVYKNEMSSHAAAVHDEKCQFKCTACPFKTLVKITFDQHLLSKHPTDMEATYVMVYQRIKGVKKSSETLEIGSDEPFDTTPLWRRDMPRIRHIRGILLEEEDDTSSSEPSTKASKRKNEDSTSKSSKPKALKNSFLDECKSLKDEIETLSVKDPLSDKTPAGSESDAGSEAGAFGSYGKPCGIKYVCTLCHEFKSKYKHDMRDHLYRELKYARWNCKVCGYLTVTHNSLLKHYVKHHPNEKMDEMPMPKDNAVETWVATLLKKQTDQIKKAMLKQNSPLLPVKSDPDVKPPEKSIKQEKIYDFEDDSKDSDVKESITENCEPSNAKKVKKSDKSADKTMLICKHCSMKFDAWQGFKRHVRLSHLKCYSFLCPYCDRSSRAEHLLLQHIRSKHPGEAETVVKNSNKGPELTDEFWAREYGLVTSKKMGTKRKRHISDDEVDKGESGRYACNWCHYEAMNLAGLKSHQRTHERILKCVYCTYSTPYRSEFVQHSAVNHPNVPVKFETRSTNQAKSVNTEIEPETLNIEDYADDIEEEEEEEVKEVQEELLDVYSCSYCTFSSISIQAIRGHFNVEHKKDDIHAKSFGYRKLKGCKENSYRIFKCCYCSLKATVAYLLTHVPQNHGTVPVHFMEVKDDPQDFYCCILCKEICQNATKLKHHTELHSHRAPNYQLLPQKMYKCAECSYETENLLNMRKHVPRHINLFKCKYCTEAFGSSIDSARHNAEKHPNLDPKIESIQDFNSQVNNLMFRTVKSAISSLAQYSSGVARKSTSKSSLLLGSPSKLKAVARKSTTPRRQLQVAAVSYYGKPREPVDLSRLNTQMTLGGITMKVTCLRLSSIVNINPKVLLEDFRRFRKGANNVDLNCFRTKT